MWLSLLILNGEAENRLGPWSHIFFPSIPPNTLCFYRKISVLGGVRSFAFLLAIQFNRLLSWWIPDNRATHLAWETAGEGEKKKNDKKMTQKEGKWNASLNPDHFERPITSNLFLITCIDTPSAARYTPVLPEQNPQPWTDFYFIARNSGLQMFLTPEPLVSSCTNLIPQL